MKLLHTIKIPALKGEKTIADSKLFTYIDSDFKDYGTNKPGKKTEQKKLQVYEMDKDGNFQQLFDSLQTNTQTLALSQEQILHFVENHKDLMRQDGYATFFLFKTDDEFFVAGVGLDSVGPRVGVGRLSDDYVWDAEDRRRVVTPQISVLKEDNLTYQTWRKMIDRCDNPKAEKYPIYGGRGISYCEKWVTFEEFLEDMGEKPEGKSIDRIDVNGDYCKENCRWATPKEQASNRRDNIKFNGETAKDASLRLGGGPNLVQQRVRHCGWSIEDAFTIPLGKAFEVPPQLALGNFNSSFLEERIKALEDWKEHITNTFRK